MNESINSDFLKSLEASLRQSFENDPDNPGLHANVVSSLRGDAINDNIKTFLLEENYQVEGKSRPRTIEIYFEFEIMGNKERTIVETISDREVTADDIEKLANLRNDLHYFSKAVLYYDGSLTDEAKLLAEKINIELKYFDFFNEIRRQAAKRLGKVLPTGPKVERSIVGDPFWIIMETTQAEENTGNYYQQNGYFILFLSKKHAQKYMLESLNGNWDVFGVSQDHLRIMTNYAKNISYFSLKFLIVFPEVTEFDGIRSNHYDISGDNLIEFYYRG